MDARTREALREREGKRPRNSPAVPARGGQEPDLLGGIANRVTEFASLSFLSPPLRPALQAEHRYEHDASHRTAAPALSPELGQSPANKNDWEYFDPESQFPPWLPGIKVPKSSMRSFGGSQPASTQGFSPPARGGEGGGGGSSGDTRNAQGYTAGAPHHQGNAQGYTASAPHHQGNGLRPMPPDPDPGAAGSTRALVEAAMAATGEGRSLGDGEARRAGGVREEGKVKTEGLRETAWIRSSEFTVVVDVGFADAPQQEKTESSRHPPQNEGDLEPLFPSRIPGLQQASREGATPPAQALGGGKGAAGHGVVSPGPAGSGGFVKGTWMSPQEQLERRLSLAPQMGRESPDSPGSKVPSSPYRGTSLIRNTPPP